MQNADPAVEVPSGRVQFMKIHLYRRRERYHCFLAARFCGGGDSARSSLLVLRIARGKGFGPGASHELLVLAPLTRFSERYYDGKVPERGKVQQFQVSRNLIFERLSCLAFLNS